MKEAQLMSILDIVDLWKFNVPQRNQMPCFYQFRGRTAALDFHGDDNQQIIEHNFIIKIRRITYKEKAALSVHLINLNEQDQEIEVYAKYRNKQRESDLITFTQVKQQQYEH